jgi:DNA-binding NtrC family response regulator
VTAAGNKVLIVDGQEGICALFSEYLRNEGMIPVVAHTAEAALEKVRTVVPDLLIVDLKLPGMDGLRTMKAAMALHEDLPTILVTGNPSIREAVSAIRAGAHGYLEKPLKHHEVLRVVFRVLNESAHQRKLRRLSSQAKDAACLRESMGPSRAVTRLIAEVTRVAKTNFSVLILGKPGRERTWWRAPSTNSAPGRGVRSSRWIAERFQKR